MFKYDGNTGDVPALGDYVEVIHSGTGYDGLRGKIGGWSDHAQMIALIALDKPMSDGRTIVGWPVVCLKPVLSAIEHLKSVQKTSFLNAFETVDSEYNIADLFPEVQKQPEVDSNGYTIWHGGDYRPVPDDTIIAVKLRGGMKQKHRDAKYWYQIHWMHRHKDHEMNKWDIVAYKVVK